MQQSRIDLKKLRLQIALQYGIELDETALAILAILLQEGKRQFTPMHTKLAEMGEQIQQSKKALQVDPDHPRWQAFLHGMGQWGLGLCLGVIALLVVFSITLSNDKKQQDMQQALVWYKEHYEAAQKLIDKAGTGTIGKKSRQRNK
ncbi:hypothetical protein [Niabella drilacis]|uniref:Uncharacterized protein n=1 Tax=Niabella drilacis (strain DSM 25811 / CCM 8410 / CCUG 62505 / LMG 26954 / E90) TaxID=1285928 RepID=A0A1G6QYB0_NIADE|nr:hypothetical protein [Niabella drilacis]SDC96646.1 hypothetical protein SAMN04487894_10548 [Niabella drilacis]